MDSIQKQEHLLCVIPFPEPKTITTRIKERFPNIKITYLQNQLNDQWATHDALPEGTVNRRNNSQAKTRPNTPVAETWKDVTVLCSLAEFPRDPKWAPNLGESHFLLRPRIPRRYRFALTPLLSTMNDRLFTDFIHIVSAGTDHFWTKPIYKDSHIPITTSSGIHGPMIAEWVMMTSLVASHRYNLLHQWQMNQTWDGDDPKGGSGKGKGKAVFHSVTDQVGQRLGILGYGSIGRHVARITQAMGMDVIVLTASPRPTPQSRKDAGFIVPGTGDPDGSIPSAWYSGTDKESLHHFLGQDIDHLLVSVPLTTATRGLLGRDEFAILAKRNAFVSNIARGEIIVQDDLIDALRTYETDATTAVEEGRPRKGLRGAALDVTTPEPLPKGHPLWEAPNCIITPHMSGVSKEYNVRAFQVLEANLHRRKKGRELLNVIDRKTGYATN